MTSADSTLVVAELRGGLCSFLLALWQVLTLPWWWQSLEVVLYLPTCTVTIADSTLVVAELRGGLCSFLLALWQVLTLPWWWQS